MNFRFDCEVGVSGNQTGKHLANQPYGILNHIGLYLMFSGGNGLSTVFICKCSEDVTRLLCDMSRGSRDTSLYNAAHLAQFPLVAEDLIVESPSDMSSDAARKLLWKQVRLEGSTTNRTASAGRYIWDLPVLCYHEIMVIYPYPFLVAITQLFFWIIFINDCICILTSSPK